MKTFAFVFLLAVCLTNIFAQKDIMPTYKGDLSNEDFFNQAEYIFEGIPISSQCFAVDSSKYDTYYTSIIIKITEVYKGELKTGIVELITKGGRIDFPNGDQVSTPFYYKLSIAANRPQVFFCVKSDLPMNSIKIEKENPITVKLLRDEPNACIKVGGYIFWNNNNKWIDNNKDFLKLKNFIFSDKDLYGISIVWGSYDDKIVGLKNLFFNSKEEFFNYIKQFKGINIPQKEINKYQDGGDNIKFKEQKIMFDEFMQKQTKLAKIGAVNKTKLKQKNPETVNNLTLQINNQIITGTGPFYFEFDIYGSSSSNAYYDNAISRLDFNTNAFGTNLVANNKVTLTKGTTFNSTTYITNAYDVSSTRINLGFGGDDVLSSWNRTLLTATPVQLFHVKIELLPNLNNILSNLVFIETTFTPMFSWYTTTANAPNTQVITYDNTNYINPSSYSISTLPIITNFNPTTIHAGTGDILTINGSNFGNSQGDVIFKSADNGGSSELLGLDNSNIILWSNTQIQVKVPSFVMEGYNSPEFGSAGSGPIKVKTAIGGTSISINALNIDYSITNVGTSSQPISKVYLAKLNCDKDILFTLHTNVASNNSAVTVIESVLSAWSTKLGINLALERDVSNNLVTVSSNNITGKNVIWFNSSIPYGMATVRSFAQEGVVYPAYTYYRKSGSDIEMAIYPVLGATWDYNTSGTTPAGKASFYQAFLHEIGHIVSLDHVNTTTDLMYYVMFTNSTIYNLTTTSNSVVASNSQIITPSKTMTWLSPTIGTLASTATTVTTPTITASGALCNNGNVTLTSSSAPAYKWTTGATSQSITVSSIGSYSVTVTQQSCTASSVPYVVTTPYPVISSFVINGGASSTTNQNLILNNTTTGSPTHYKASGSSSFTGASWQTYSVNPTFNLGNASQGTKTIYFKVKNAYGESNVRRDNIYFGPLMQKCATTNIPPSQIHIEETIATSKTWSNNTQYVEGTLRILDGKTLNIINSEVLLSENSKIIVEKGGKLHINQNSVLQGCNNGTWRGIEVRGDNTKPQTPNFQGRVIVDKSIIKDAEIGIFVGERNESTAEIVSSGSGGILKVINNSEVRNNGVHLYFTKYENKILQTEIRDSKFNQESMTVQYDNATMHIFIDGAKELQIKNNEFTSGNKGLEINGSEKINIHNNTINDVTEVISVLNTSELLVEGNIIQNGNIGINIQQGNKSGIINNKFDNFQSGIILENSEVFDLSLNTFNNIVEPISTYNTTTSIEESQISSNQFNSPEQAIKFNNDNHSKLNIQCNEFNNFTKFAIKSESTLLKDQGTALEGANNKFISNSTFQYNLLDHNGSPITYFYDPVDAHFFTSPNIMSANVAKAQSNMNGNCNISNKSFLFNNKTDNYTNNLNNIDKNNIEISPNPNNGIFNITTDLPNNNSFSLKIVDVLGQILYNKTEINFEKSFSVDISNHQSGIYYLIIKLGEKFFRKMVIIE